MNKENILRILGVVLFIAANTVLTITDAPIDRRYHILSALCEKYLLSHSEWDVPPNNCEVELTYLQKRVKSSFLIL